MRTPTRRRGKTVKRGVYDVHNNGGRPFRVYVNGPAVSVYKGVIVDDAGTYAYDQLVLKVRAKKAYVGGKGADAGNSVLLHLSGNKYLYIGAEIYAFQMEDRVDAYFSLLGNSDVPYPVVLGTTYAYFMLPADRCYVPRAAFSPAMTANDWENAYERYYGLLDPMTGKEQPYHNLRHKPAAKKMKGLRMIADANARRRTSVSIK